MAWDYRYTGHKMIQHKAGTVPPRPLEVGDTVIFDAGLGFVTHVIVATTPTLLLFADVGNGSGVLC